MAFSRQGDTCVCQARTGVSQTSTHHGFSETYQCQLASPAEPAFLLKIPDAVRLVKNGLANFIHRNSAVQLNYSRLAHLRDRSAKVDEQLVFDYAIGLRYARAAIDLGWGRAQVG